MKKNMEDVSKQSRQHTATVWITKSIEHPKGKFELFIQNSTGTHGVFVPLTPYQGQMLLKEIDIVGHNETDLQG